jgi:twinkle protein
MIDVKALSNMLAERAESVAKYLLPGGVVRGRELEAGSVHGEAGKSLKVCVAGAKQGVWSDFAAGVGGDMVDLWVATRGVSLTEAIREIKDYLGVSDPTFVKSKRREYRRPERPAGAVKVAKEKKSRVSIYLTAERGLDEHVLGLYRIGEVDKIGPWEGWKNQKPAVGPWVVFPYIRGNELLGVKYLHLERKEGKKFTLVEPGCEPTLFGWHAIDPNARIVTICEGELDAVSLYQYGYPALSVPFGGGKGDKQQWVDHDWEHLERFETIYLCMDADDAGREATAELVMRLGQHRCHIVTLPCKDANECLIKGITKEQVDTCFANATTIKPEELRSAKEFYAEVLDEFYPSGGELPGWSMPWSEVPFRFLRGEVSIITGVNGHGKSLLWGQLMLAAGQQGERCCIASLEMAPRKTLTRMVRQASGRRRPHHLEVATCLDWMADKVWLFDLVGTGKVDRLLEVFLFAYRRHGVRQFVIDSMMKLGIGEDDYRGQKDLMDRLCDFAIKHGIHIHLICHPRKGEDESPPGKMDIKGTGAISDLAFNTFTVWRNKDKELRLAEHRETGALPKGMTTLEELEEKPDAFLMIHKARNVEECEGRYRLYYHVDSMRYLRDKSEPLTIMYDIDGDEPPF